MSNNGTGHELVDGLTFGHYVGRISTIYWEIMPTWSRKTLYGAKYHRFINSQFSKCFEVGHFCNEGLVMAPY